VKLDKHHTDKNLCIFIHFQLKSAKYLTWPNSVEKLIVDIEFIYTTIKITNEFKNVSVTVGVVEVGMDDRR